MIKIFAWAAKLSQFTRVKGFVSIWGDMVLAKRLPIFMPRSFTAAKNATSVASLRCLKPFAHVELNAVFNSRNLCPIHDPSKAKVIQLPWQRLNVASSEQILLFKVGAGWIFPMMDLAILYFASSWKPATAVVNVHKIKIHQRLDAQWKWTPSSNPGRFVPLWSIKGKCHLATVALGPYSW